jgi:uncharacterized membrane protein YecN with MAPEG domain
MHPLALFCTAALGLLLFGLGFAVSRERIRERRGAGLPDDPASMLLKLGRAHANTAEFAPFLAVVFRYLGANDPGTIELALIVGATLARFLLPIGLIATPTLEQTNPWRFAGALGTYVFGLALCVALLARL